MMTTFNPRNSFFSISSCAGTPPRSRRQFHGCTAQPKECFGSEATAFIPLYTTFSRELQERQRKCPSSMKLRDLSRAFGRNEVRGEPDVVALYPHVITMSDGQRSSSAHVTGTRRVGAGISPPGVRGVQQGGNIPLLRWLHRQRTSQAVPLLR